MHLYSEVWYNIKNGAFATIRLLMRNVDKCLSGVIYVVDKASAF